MPAGPPSPSADASTPPTLVRRLGLGDAVVLGVGSMLGAGVFAVLAPASAAAGRLLLLGLAVAAVVAYANAMSTAQLAAAMPTSGGAYRYGRERLGPWPGFVAGWCFVVGKTASCAAMAMTFAAYAAPQVQRPVAVAAVVVLVAVNARGITRTARLTRVLVTVTLLVLGAVVTVGAWSAAGPGPVAAAPPGAPPCPSGPCGGGVLGVLQSAGLLFFALAGYARLATLGEEVVRPRVVIPQAVRAALAIVVAVYAAVAVVALGVLGPDRLAASAAPLVDVVVAAGAPGGLWWVRVGAAAACLGALLGLVAGVGRTAFAMAQDGELPRALAAVHPRHRVPHRAQGVVGAAVVVGVLVADVTTLIAFSSFGVLVYYAIANAAAFGQVGPDRRTPRGLQVLGLAGCALLVLTLPPSAVLAGAGVLVAGVVVRASRLGAGRRGRRRAG
ncbi:APC family permease [Cellulomonas aerilata]|uniref:Amino acid transporter n=1 Tax=Cellulomonas aerilata TaxID=515326 RepID=A0A512DEY1_9CELL|nr:amino acid permease [Cellulomonas aerilata]GEO35006.1 amino acid transporter [Cellulomonas aerilata]